MRTDRVITIKTKGKSLTLTRLPYTVQSTSGFDTVTVRNNTSQGYSQDGATLLGCNVQVRSLSLQGQVYAATTQEMEARRLALLDIFAPKTDILVTQEYGGVRKSITARATRTPRIDFTAVSSIQSWEVSLQAMMPYWEDSAAAVVEIADVVGGMHFPLATPTHFGVRRASMIATVVNESIDDVGMEIRFIAHGIVKDPQLLNVYTRESIKVSCTMQENEVITITTGDKKSVTRRYGGADENYLSRIDLAGGNYAFLKLAPGSNTLRMAAAEGEGMLETQILFKNRYAGV